MPKQPPPPTGEVILYPTEDGRTRYPGATIRKFRNVASNPRHRPRFCPASPIRDALRRELSWTLDRNLPGIV